MGNPNGQSPDSGPLGSTGKRQVLPWEAAIPPRTETPKAPSLAPRRQGTNMGEVKGRIHRRLLERLNLSNLDKIERDQVVDAIRRVTVDLLTQESVPLNSRSARFSSTRSWTRSSGSARSSR